MEIISTQKFVRTSPRKLRLIADAVRSMAPVTAVSVLAYSGKRASDPLSKVIKSALANATQQGFSQKDMIFKEIQISEGPRLKRGRPISRGMYHPIKKRMSHIRVALTLATASSSKTAQKEEVTPEVVAEQVTPVAATKAVKAVASKKPAKKVAKKGATK